MGKFIAKWNSGYGNNCEVIEAENMEEALRYAEDLCREEMESNIDFGAEPLTKESAEDYGFEDELDEQEQNDGA